MPDKEYMKKYRRDNPGYREQMKAIERARLKAFRQLADKFPVEFAVLFEAAKRAENV